MKVLSVAIVVSLVIAVVTATGKYRGLEFLDPCYRYDPELEACLAKSANVLTEHFRNGLPQLGYPIVEPIILDKIHITLGDQPDSYRAEFCNITATGVSALRVDKLRANITDNEVQVQLTLSIPRIQAKAKYESSGLLLKYIRASGGGDYWGKYDGVVAKVFIRANPFMYENKKYLELTRLKMDFRVRNMTMGVKNLDHANEFMEAGLNLFINSNSQDLLKEMKPDLRNKLMEVMVSFIKKIFYRVPYDAWITE